MDKTEILVILYPGCIFFEIALVTELLGDKCAIVYASPDGEDHKTSNGTTITGLESYENIDPCRFRAVLIPGGDPGSVKDNKYLDEIIQSTHEVGVLLAAICAGSFILAKAGVLKGKKIAHGYESEQIEHLKSFFEGVILTEESIVCDHNIITAKPESHIDFAVEVSCRLGCVDASKTTRIKDYYKGILGKKIRPLALAHFQNSNGQMLLHKGFDSQKNEHFYRPLGGGIEFSETGSEALQREIMEELGQSVSVSKMIASFENIFTFEGIKGHEIIMLYSCAFVNSQVYEQPELEIYESGSPIAKAVWRSLEEIKKEGANLYPDGLEDVLAK